MGKHLTVPQKRGIVLIKKVKKEESIMHPLIEISCLPYTDQLALELLRQDLVKATMGIQGLEVEDEEGIEILFPEDMREGILGEHIVIKMHTGYNTGINLESITSITEVGYKEAIYKIPEKTLSGYHFVFQ